jgi:hypothetical protein
MSLWLVNGINFIRPDRQQVRAWVLDGVGYPMWSAYVTTSYKKHGFTTPINRGRFGIWKYDDTLVDCRNNALIRDMFSGMCEFQQRGVSRPIMESMTASVSIIKKIGIPTWTEFLRFAETRQGRAWQFLCYLLPSREEIENENRVDGGETIGGAEEKQRIDEYTQCTLF